MSCNLTFLPPEPIALIDEDDESETTTDERDACNISVASMSTYGISNRRRSNSAINSNYNFLKAQVSDCTLMGGHNGGKFAVWKITIVLQPVSRDKRAAAATPQIHIYKRYSQFVTFREELLEELHEIKEEAVRVQDRERTSKLMAIKVPPLPPPVPWYSYWQYQDVNMSKKWLMERRRGLEYFMNYVILNRCIVENCKKVILSFIERKDG
ncbi:Ypt35p KNAG_0B04290 [Huiozyma naganishii CBS 8797]|uniref:PX domain-containing protein n=1 Tax=Huiozyma naganishii (strain ATCC MYA-139 / BCRC 22969 / CBS 8797 / KCTC 17520 / NBRC 10181 / NCYC 3082 / Yp74L-3) TaxID=1071383 RepID=J7S3R5_HUIN7|nr:hypothetical protein KNAG_0B04290 [Kazachstania naganishii CBS 8797]CCK68864.1 hypothetical protein KNAG_0B04290 [Kazachstania naganishii CBS 8797]